MKPEQIKRKIEHDIKVLERGNWITEYFNLSDLKYLLKAIDHMENGKKSEDVNPFDLSDIAKYNRKKQKS